MIFFIAFSTLLGTLYCLYILGLLIALKRNKQEFNKLNAQPKVSVIVPFKNEAEHLKNLLGDLSQQTYPTERLEILIINDHSTDDGLSIIRSHSLARASHLKLLNLERTTGKKAALEWGWKECKGQIILQTDADCRLAPQWIETMIAANDVNDKIQIGLVRMMPTSNFWSRFAALEYLSLQGISAGMILIGKPIMGSAANLLYPVELVKDLSSFGSRQSGDDTFLIHKATTLGKVGLSQDSRSIVETGATKTLGELLNQRARWGGKSVGYESPLAKALAAFIAVFNLSFLVLAVIGYWFQPAWLLLLGLFIAKALVDWLFLKETAKITGQQSLLDIYGLASLIYPFYIAAVGLKIIFGSAVWKDQKLKPWRD